MQLTEQAGCQEPAQQTAQARRRHGHRAGRTPAPSRDGPAPAIAPALLDQDHGRRGNPLRRRATSSSNRSAPKNGQELPWSSSPCGDRPISRRSRICSSRPTGPSPISTFAQRVVSEFEATQRVNLVMQPYDDLQVVPAVACYPDDLTLVTEEVTGPTLLEHLRARAAWFPAQHVLDDLCASMQAVGRWVRALQTAAGGESRLTPQGIAAYVDHRLKQLVQCSGSRFHESDRADVLRHIERLVERMPDEAFSTVPVHGDMALSNVLVVGQPNRRAGLRDDEVRRSAAGPGQALSADRAAGAQALHQAKRHVAAAGGSPRGLRPQPASRGCRPFACTC